MEPRDELPQIGPIDVSADVLEAEGRPLGELLAELGCDATVVPSDVPASGWREIGRNGASLALAAPLDAAGTRWRVAQVRVDESGGCSELHVHPDPQPRRASRAERAKGLELRWPAVTREAPDVDALAIDIANAGGERWRPEGDPFHVVGFIVRHGDESKGGTFGLVNGTNPPVALGPGEYARVRVTIPDGQWADLRPGAHEVHATMVTLPVRAPHPLLVELTEDVIESHRPRRRHAPRANDDRAAMRDRVELLEAMVRATERLPELLHAITAGDDDEATRTRIATLLECSDDGARAVLELQLRRFRPADARHLVTEADHLRRALAEPP